MRNVGRKNGKENSRPIRCNRWKTQKGRPLREWLDDVLRGVRGVCVRGETEIWQLCAERPETTRTALNRRVQRAVDTYTGVCTYTGSVPTELEEE